MKDIKDYLAITELGNEPSMALIESGQGFVLPDEVLPAAVIPTKQDAKFISLLYFTEGVARGNHYHLDKVEYITVLRGKLKSVFFLPENPDHTLTFELVAGQQICIQPGCFHQFTAIEADAYAIEYSTAEFDKEDVLRVAGW